MTEFYAPPQAPAKPARLRGIAEVGLVVAFVAGLVWLHQAWAISRSRTKKPTPSPGAVVLWTLVPLWGLWRLHGFILQITASSPGRLA